MVGQLPTLCSVSTTTQQQRHALPNSALAFLLILLSPSALGFTSPCRQNPLAEPLHPSSITRADLLSSVVSGSVAALIPWALPPVANSFDGGVGGLGMRCNLQLLMRCCRSSLKQPSRRSSSQCAGKTRPQTGVVFRDRKPLRRRRSRHQGASIMSWWHQTGRQCFFPFPLRG